MSTRKPRADARLKTLPEERQADIYSRLNLPAPVGGYEATLKWLRADGLQTSLGALSEFYSWYGLQQQLKRNESTVNQVLEQLKVNDPALTQSQLEQAGNAFFSALAIEQQDSLTWKRIQDAKLKLGALDLAHKKFLMESDSYMERLLKRAAELLADSKLSQADRIAAMRHEFLKDIDELEKSGEVQLPK